MGIPEEPNRGKKFPLKREIREQFHWESPEWGNFDALVVDGAIAEIKMQGNLQLGLSIHSWGGGAEATLSYTRTIYQCLGELLAYIDLKENPPV